MQAVMSASKRRFTIDVQADPVEFWSWLLNTLHMDLTGKKPGCYVLMLINMVSRATRWLQTVGRYTSLIVDSLQGVVGRNQ